MTEVTPNLPHLGNFCKYCFMGTLLDTDPQASLTVSLGNPCPDDLSPTLSDLMGKIMMENPITPDEGILHHPEGVDLVPSNIELSGMEVALVNAMSRETILRQYLDLRFDVLSGNYGIRPV